MNLNELEISKTLRKRGPINWRNLFEKNGWKFIGMGREAAVGEHPTKPYVLRVFSRDTPYVDFVSLVKQHQSNPHFPKFSRYVRPVPGTMLNYVRMEKLETVSQNQLLELPYLNQMAYLHFKCEEMNLMFHRGFQDRVAVRLRDLSNGTLAREDVRSALWQKIGRPDHSWTEAVDLVLNLHRSGTSWPSTLDMHAGNFMMRNDTLVITDPLVGI